MKVSNLHIKGKKKKFPKVPADIFLLRITNFLNRIVKLCKSQGYVRTFLGRRRYLPEINSKDPTYRKRAERQAMNSVCQGSAADLVKKAMCKVDLVLR